MMNRKIVTLFLIHTCVVKAYDYVPFIEDAAKGIAESVGMLVIAKSISAYTDAYLNSHAAQDMYTAASAVERDNSASSIVCFVKERAHLQLVQSHQQKKMALFTCAWTGAGLALVTLSTNTYQQPLGLVGVGFLGMFAYQSMKNAHKLNDERKSFETLSRNNRGTLVAAMHNAREVVDDNIDIRYERNHPLWNVAFSSLVTGPQVEWADTHQLLSRGLMHTNFKQYTHHALWVSSLVGFSLGAAHLIDKNFRQL